LDQESVIVSKPIDLVLSIAVGAQLRIVILSVKFLSEQSRQPASLS